MGELFPAPAGMNRFAGSAERPKWPVPRPRGDEPTGHITNTIIGACSPPPRG